MSYSQYKREDLVSLVESRDQEIQELKEQVENLSYFSRSEIPDEKNGSLPLPRVEIRYEMKRDLVVASLNLVYRNLIKGIQVCTESVTEISTENPEDYFTFKDEPFRASGDLRNLMYEFNLPGFLVYQDQYKRVDLEDINSIPNGLLDKMKNKGSI